MFHTHTSSSRTDVENEWKQTVCLICQQGCGQFPNNGSVWTNRPYSTGLQNHLMLSAAQCGIVCKHIVCVFGSGQSQDTGVFRSVNSGQITPCFSNLVSWRLPAERALVYLPPENAAAAEKKHLKSTALLETSHVSPWCGEGKTS